MDQDWESDSQRRYVEAKAETTTQVQQVQAQTLTSDGQIEVEGEGGPFSAGGDSGSLVVDSDLRACGLLFAGSQQGGRNGLGLTFLNEIAPVLRGLGLSLDLAPAMA